MNAQLAGLDMGKKHPALTDEDRKKGFGFSCAIENTILEYNAHPAFWFNVLYGTLSRMSRKAHLTPEVFEKNALSFSKIYREQIKLYGYEDQ